MPRCSGRISRTSDRYYGDTFNASAENQVQDPASYGEVVTDVDADLWHKAMNSELESMYFNNLWYIIDAPEGIKPIWCKGIYMRK